MQSLSCFLLVLIAASPNTYGFLPTSPLTTSGVIQPQVPALLPSPPRFNRPPLRRLFAHGPGASGDDPPISDWDAAHASGQRWLHSLHATRAAPRPERHDKPVALGSLECSEPRPTIRWTPFPEVTRHWHTPLGPSLHNAYHAISVRRAPGTSPLTSLILYHNSFSAARGVLLLESNWRVYDQGPPPRPHLSDVLRACYGAAETRARGREEPPGRARAVPPRYVVQVRITARMTTAVMQRAHERRGAPKEVMQRWTPGDAEFVPLCGTPHGKTAIHLLRDFATWAEHRVVVGVATVFAQDLVQGRWGWYMLLELGTGLEKLPAEGH